MTITLTIQQRTRLDEALSIISHLAGLSNEHDLEEGKPDSLLTVTLRRAHTLLMSADGQLHDFCPNALAVEIDRLLARNLNRQPHN
jgi:hypothetical protein